MTLHCCECGHELKTFVSARTVWPTGKKKGGMNVACADLDACRVRRDEHERRARNADGFIAPSGASWTVYINEEIIGVRPDKTSALECLLQALEAT